MRLAYRNIVGVEADAPTVDYLAASMTGSGGTMSQADFLADVAQLALNQQHIGLVGLQATGVEYV